MDDTTAQPLGVDLDGFALIVAQVQIDRALRAARPGREARIGRRAFVLRRRDDDLNRVLARGLRRALLRQLVEPIGQPLVEFSTGNVDTLLNAVQP